MRGDRVTKKIAFKVNDGFLVIKIDGDLDNLATFQYKTKLTEIIKINQFKQVVIDLSNVTFIDSSGIGLMLGRYNQVTNYGGHLILCGINKQIKKTIQISGIASIIDVYEDSFEQLKNSEVLLWIN